MSNVVDFPFNREISFSEVETIFFTTKGGLVFSIDVDRNSEIWDLMIDNEIDFYYEPY
jgi:hypothetical protein